MSEERRRVLDMLSEGKVTVEEAERLLEALQDTHRETRKGRGIGALQDTLEGLGEEIEKGLEKGLKGLEESLSGWSESEDSDRDKDGKTSMRDDTFAVGDNPRLVVRGFNGRIRVLAGEPGSIRVRARLKKPRGIKYSAVQEGDLVTVEAKDQQSEGFLHGFSRQHSGANIEVTVPIATSVDLATSNGPVELHGTEGGGTVQTKNGPIRVENFKGDLNATTKNAPITVKTFSGSAELYSLNSRVSIEDAHGRFDARTTNGTIKFQGSIEPGNSNKLETTNGNIRVALDDDPSLKLTAATVNGRVRCEVPGFVAAVEKRQQLKGTVGEGKAELIAKTVNGSIVIQ
ncbi:MAG: DUF4097 family beta strand repeat-containing protein [Gemmatimonadota bacterium]|nr:DUF4097 family beta strand repeat-containing protein [Gemmatimonadota bacterium]